MRQGVERVHLRGVPGGWELHPRRRHGGDAPDAASWSARMPFTASTRRLTCSRLEERNSGSALVVVSSADLSDVVALPRPVAQLKNPHKRSLPVAPAHSPLPSVIVERYARLPLPAVLIAPESEKKTPFSVSASERPSK